MNLHLAPYIGLSHTENIQTNITENTEKTQASSLLVSSF